MDQPDRQEKIRRPKAMLAGDFRWGMIWGLIVVFIGVALLLDNMDILPFSHVSRFWPMLVVLFGLMSITTQSNRSFGFICIVAGILLQLNKFGLIHLRFHDIWPLAIIAFGVLLIWGSLETRFAVRKKFKIDWTNLEEVKAYKQKIMDESNDPSTFTAVAVFSGCERRYTGQHFQGGTVTSIFGGVELDFRDADIDDEALLEVTCIFGGVEIRVPETWYVQTRSVPIFGGLEDKTHQNKIDDSLGAKRKTLIITGQVIFGGVDIRN
jgi:hypothetical protein